MQLKEYLIKNKIRQVDMAQKLNISRHFFNQIMHGRKKLPKKYWTKVILLTQGEVSIEDLLNVKEHYETYCKTEEHLKESHEGGDSSELPKI